MIGPGRRVAAARRRWPDIDWREADLARRDTPEAWVPLPRDVEVVVNAAGLPQQGLSDDAAGLQYRAMPALYLARWASADGVALPVRFHRLYALWLACGFPTFAAVLIVVWLMLARPMFGWP